MLAFYHIPGVQNPADVLSRGTDLTSLTNNKLWWKGPQILLDPKTWPSPLSLDSKEEEKVIPVKKVMTETVPSLPLTLVEQNDILEVSASFLETVRYLKEKLNCSAPRAQDFIVRIDQTQNAPSDRECERYALAKNNGIWFVTGRLENSELPESEKHPIFLSKTSKIFPKLLFDLHSRVHPNLSTTLSSLRPFVFCPGGRSHLKNVLIKVCEPCRRAFARPFALPPIPALPDSRVSRNRPFSFVGMDCCGPFAVLQKQRLCKTYLLVITCLSTRYTHLEQVERGTAQSLVLAFRRFVALFGLPLEILSDHGRNFELGAKVLKRFSGQIATLGPIRWQFTTPYSPWKGGVYERMIKLLKEALRKSLPKKPLHSEMFCTVVSEIGAMLNQRPILSGLSNTVTPRCLRPVDLVFPEKRESFPLFVEQTDPSDPDYVPYVPPQSDQIAQDWSRSMSRVNRFWKSFHQSYLRYLQTVGKPRVGRYETPRVGQVVLLLKPSETNRNLWKTAVVKKVNLSVDGFCRSVILESEGREFERPISQIAPLELPPIDSLLDGLNSRTLSVHRSRRLRLGGQRLGEPSTASKNATSLRPRRRIADRPYPLPPTDHRLLPDGSNLAGSAIRISPPYRSPRNIRGAGRRGIKKGRPRQRRPGRKIKSSPFRHHQTGHTIYPLPSSPSSFPNSEGSTQEDASRSNPFHRDQSAPQSVDFAMGYPAPINSPIQSNPSSDSFTTPDGLHFLASEPSTSHDPTGGPRGMLGSHPSSQEICINPEV
ncbi:unnamed protein product [Bursaphelenchus xylophilus]|uniref:(pine wood nematode) hypothetical protein n=1 Tax=Bursaphelenchus xylophilus TaxID=6326 RepID=A0A1I7SCP1_BURXY|nr:unnamed protein product [Bursaphelenchus xylophilus]CAG9093758.1 unnamed protein product [Bursaphelenchus xylophilus]